MTLWCIARSPLILGGNLPKNDEFTLSVLTNDEVIAVNQNSANNRQLFNTNNQVAWVADVPGSKDKYVALFNTSPTPAAANRRTADNSAGTNAVANADTAKLPVQITVSLSDIGVSGRANVRDLWAHKDLGAVNGQFTATINSHGAGLYRFSPAD